MLPKFPEFKKLELSDQQEIEKIFLKYEPYSDFDFASLWSWDVDQKIRISNINGNLVAILYDHFTGQPFYSFLGDKEVAKTIKQIFAFSQITENHLPILRAVPEVSLRGIDFNKFLIEIDLNNCDYVYSTADISTYDGPKYSHKRKLYNRFTRNNPDRSIEILDITKTEIVHKIIELSNCWLQNKGTEDEGLNLKKELKAIERFLSAGFNDTLCIGLFVKDKMIGYQLCTLLPNKYSICHFGKIDTSYHYAFEYMMSKSCELLLERGVNFLNTEEDLGLPQLRFSKDSYRPTAILRKYTIKEL